MAGSSYFKIIRTNIETSITGPTGPMGKTGPVGSDGSGPTGITGVGIQNISLQNNKILTEMTNGVTYITSESLTGVPGTGILQINVTSGGSGASIISSQSAQNSITFRSLKGSTSTSGRSEIKVNGQNGSTLSIEYIVSTDGLTLLNLEGADALGGLIRTNETGLSLTNIADTRYDIPTSSVVFGSKNIVEKARGLGFTGATQAEFGSRCNYAENGFIDAVIPTTVVYIHPDCKSNNNVDYGTRNKIYVITGAGKIIIGDPVSVSTSSAFTLVVRNGVNSTVTNGEKRFQSTSGNVYWPFGREPKFTTTDVYHFYNLFGSWFGSIVQTVGNPFPSANIQEEEDGEGEEDDELKSLLKSGACCEEDPCPPHKRVNSLVSSDTVTAYVDSYSKKIKYWSSPSSPFSFALSNKIPSNYKSYKISIGSQHLCSIDNETYGITCWGFPGVPVVTNTPTNTGYTAISSSPGHNLAINNSGGVTAWGDNFYGQCNIPSGLTNVKQVAAGLYHSMALKTDGTVACWGAGTVLNASPNSDDINQNQCILPAGITFSYIAAFDMGGLGIASKGGTVYAWGATMISNNVPSGLTAVRVAGSMDSSAPFIAYKLSGSGFAVAIKSDGTVVGWGNTLSTQNILPTFEYSGASEVSLGKIHGNVISNNILNGWGNGLSLPCDFCGITCNQKTPADCSGVNQYFRGIGTTCNSQICEITGPCCMTIGCDSPSQSSAQCFPGITLENCICGRFTGSLQNGSFDFHYASNNCSSCVPETCNSGACCLSDGSCETMSSENCLSLGGKYNQGQKCENLPINFCDMGRCCMINLSDLSKSSCNMTVQSDCVGGSGFLADWSTNETCESSPCYLKGSCCTGVSNCKNDAVTLPDILSKFETSITDSNYCSGFSFNNNVNCDSTTCGSGTNDLGLCLEFDCKTAYTISHNEQYKLEECMSNFIFSKFFKGINSGTKGKCCIKNIEKNTDECIDNLTAAECYSAEKICITGEPIYKISFTPNVLCESGCTYPDGSIFSTQGGGDAISSDGTINNNYNYVEDYYPSSSDLYGKDFKKCCPVSFDNLNKGDEVVAKTYTSQTDWYGYGVKDINNSDNKAQNIKFKIFVYNKDLSYEDDDGNIIKNVIWGQTENNCAWGPNVEKDNNEIYYINDLKYFDKTYSYYNDEGYWQVTNVNYSPEILLDKTYNKQPNLQFITSIGGLVNTEDSKFSNNGGWRRNWGIYNTMRMIGADNAYYALNNPVPGVTYNLPNEWTAARLVDKLNSESNFNSATSSWFIPSIDEMAFLCNNIKQITKNMIEPMIGDYWTSTGTFDEKTNEGKKTKLKSNAQNGSKAWIFSIQEKKVFLDEDEYPYDITIRKEDRSSLLKVRPIRIELENVSDVPLKGTEEYKVWRLQPIKWVREIQNK